MWGQTIITTALILLGSELYRAGVKINNALTDSTSFQEGKKSSDKKKDKKSSSDKSSEKKENKSSSDKKQGDKKVQKQEEKKSFQYESSYIAEVKNKWVMPAELKEISGITFISETEIACIQDEAGIIFIYDLSTKKISKTYSFAGAGDFEGIVYTNNLFYVLRSDGIIFQIDPQKPKDYKTFESNLRIENNCEGLAFDKKSNSLLIAIKALDPTDQMKKGIYKFDLKSMQATTKPFVSIDLEDTQLIDPGKKKDLPARRYHPSDLAVDPVTGNLMIVNGVNSSLMILTPAGKIDGLISLDKKIFPQPEGICYSPSGKLYISSEGGAGSGVIAECGIRSK